MFVWLSTSGLPDQPVLNSIRLDGILHYRSIEREREIVVCDLTCNGLSDNGGVVVRVVARVEKVVVKGSVKPIVEKFHRTHMKQSCEHHTSCSPHGKVTTTREQHRQYVEQNPIQQDLVIPAPKHTHNSIPTFKVTNLQKIYVRVKAIFVHNEREN